MLTYKFRLYPTTAQEQKLLGTLEACRYAYNYFVRNGYTNRNDMNYALTELKEQEPWLNNYHSKMLQMVSTQVAGARKALKELRKKGYDAGKLRFRKYGEFDTCNTCNTCIYNQSGFGIDAPNNTLYLDRIGKIKMKIHRSIVGSIKHIALKRKAGRWYACITTDNNYRMVHSFSILKPIDFRKAAGIDVGIKNYAYDSDGNVTPNPENLKKMLKPLIRAQRKVSRRVKGSQNHRKARRWFEIVHERITNRRKDFLHKLSAHYASRYDVIFLERLKVLNMVKNHSLAMSITDAAWSTFKDMIGYKAKLMLEVESRDSTIDCSRCGNKVPKSLAIRIHRCDRCGLVMDRDYNASLNILQRGLRSLQSLGVPQELRELTPVEILIGSRKQEAHVLRRG